MFLTELECHDGALILNYFLLFLKDPRYERIIDVLPIKVELSGEKIKKIRKVNEMRLMLMMFRNFHLSI